MRIWELLEGLGGPARLDDEIDFLGRLAGEEIGPARFLNTVAQSAALRAPWMPPWFIPLGAVVPDRVFGLDLRPELLAQNRVCVAEVHGPGDLIGVTDGLESYLRWQLARAEKRERMDNPAFVRSPELVAAHKRAWRAFERDLFGEADLAGVDDVLAWLWERGGSGALAASLRDSKDPRENLARYLESENQYPGCMYTALLGAGAAQALADMDLVSKQTSLASRAMRYTQHSYRLAMARPLATSLGRFYPADFDTAALRRFLAVDAAALSAALAAPQDADDAARLATDLGYESDTTALLPRLQAYYSAAGWTVAASLCERWYKAA